MDKVLDFFSKSAGQHFLYIYMCMYVCMYVFRCGFSRSDLEDGDCF